MKLSIINGSPRGNSSNSTKMISWITKGITTTEYSLEYLNNVKKHNDILDKEKNCDSFLFCFPLYVDSMPAQVKNFFELMENQKEDFKGKSITFIIHSGFPERIQSENLKEYLELFTDLMGMKLLGVIIIPGSEALQMAPDKMFSRQIKIIEEIIPLIEKEISFPEDINIRISKNNRLSKFNRILFSINPLKNFYWHLRASKHDHKVNIKARPY